MRSSLVVYSIEVRMKDSILNKSWIWGMILLWIFTTMLACEGSVTPVTTETGLTGEPTTPGLPTETLQPTATQPSVITPPLTVPPSPLPAKTPDLATRPQIWFGPLDPSPPNADRPFCGCEDFFDLFGETAPWERAAEGVEVFKLYGGWVAWVASDAELRQVVEDVNRRGMALAFEAGPLTPTDECTGEIEGFAGPEEAIRIVQKIKAAGGRITYVDLEHPYDAATFADAPQACKMTPEEIAGNVSRFVQTVRTVFPEAVFGAVETAQHDVDHVAQWVEAYRAVMGEDLAYFHLDLDYGQPNWPQRAKEIETYLRSQRIEFGLFYLGDWQDTTDAEWVARAEGRFVKYEVEYGGRPEHVIFQSWHPHPERLLPETDPSTFTFLINRYFRSRTNLTLYVERATDGLLALSGALMDRDATALSGAPIALALKPADGSGFIYEYSLTGIVPEGATEADVGYRVNLECNCSGPADFNLYEVRYTEADETANRIPNPDFALGYEGWSPWGEAIRRLKPSDRGAGLALHVVAQPDQGAAINSAKFPTTPGASYTVTFVARVSPDSQGSGYFNLIFDNETREIRRFTLPLRPAVIPLGAAISDGDGVYQFDTDDTFISSVALEAWYPGDQEHWPAFASEVLPGP
jgi:hypothetical protein